MLFFAEKDNRIKPDGQKRQGLSDFLQNFASKGFALNLSKNLQFGIVIPTPPMSANQRNHIRFPLTLQARRKLQDGSNFAVLIRQISVGGCMLEWDEGIGIGEKLKIEILMPNGNWFPVMCKILYRIPEKGLGMRFIEVTQFEQELLAKIIMASLERYKMPVENPFSIPPKFDTNSHGSEAFPEVARA